MSSSWSGGRLRSGCSPVRKSEVLIVCWLFLDWFLRLSGCKLREGNVFGSCEQRRTGARGVWCSSGGRRGRRDGDS